VTLPQLQSTLSRFEIGEYLGLVLLQPGMLRLPDFPLKRLRSFTYIQASFVGFSLPITVSRRCSYFVDESAG